MRPDRELYRPFQDGHKRATSARRAVGRKAGQLKMPIAFLDARQNFSAETLPPSLSRIRLSRRTPLGAARFFPDSEEEALLGIFASWK